MNVVTFDRIEVTLVWFLRCSLLVREHPITAATLAEFVACFQSEIDIA